MENVTNMDTLSVACPECGGSDTYARTFSEQVLHRGMSLDVEGLSDMKCGNCQHSWETSAQHDANLALTKRAYAETREQIRSSQGLLLGTEIAAIRDSLGLTQRRAAELFGGGYNAFNKYESGEVLQSFAMDRLLRLATVLGAPIVDFLSDVKAKPTFQVVLSNDAHSTINSWVEMHRLKTHLLNIDERVVDNMQWIFEESFGSGAAYEFAKSATPGRLSGHREIKGKHSRATQTALKREASHAWLGVNALIPLGA